MALLPLDQHAGILDIIDALNRIVYRDRGASGYPDIVVWRPNSASYGLDLDNDGAGGQHANFGSGVVTIKDSGLATTQQIASSLATGTAPLSIASTTKVNNLNVDKLDGADATVTPTANAIPIADGAGVLAAGWIPSLAGSYLPLGGGTLTGALLFSPDNTVSIGDSTHRPQYLYVGTRVGVGVASPSYPLDVSGTLTDWAAKVNQASSGAGAKGLYVKTAGTGATDPILQVEGAASYLTVQSSGLVGIGATANANMTQGLTIGQGANDNEILAFKSSDVAHGITGQMETDTYAMFLKVIGNDGGLRIKAATEVTEAFVVWAFQTTENTTQSASGIAPIMFEAYTKSGTSVTTAGATSNLLTIGTNGLTRFIFRGDGNSFEDGTGWTAYDDHDDLAVLNALDHTLDARFHDPLRADFGQWMASNRTLLSDLDIVNFNDPARPFINRSRLQALLVGAIRQTGRRLDAWESRLQALEAPGE